MEIQICPSCSTELPERALYCPSCGIQVRCKACRDILEPNARACVTCGTFVGEKSEKTITNAASPDNIALNTIEYRETSRSRTFRAAITNTVANSLSEPLSHIVTGSVRSRNALQRLNSQQAQVPGQPQLPAFIQLPDDQDEYSEDIELTAGDQALGATSDIERLKRIFRFEGDSLTLINRTLKASSKLNFAKRLSYLFLYAQKLLLERVQIERSQLNAVLKQVGVFESNISRWIGHNADIAVHGNLVELTTSGIENARNILHEVLDRELKDRWTPGTSKSRRKGKKGGGEADEKQEDTVLEDINEAGVSSKSGSVSRSGRPGPGEMVNNLIGQEFFKERRTINDILQYCSLSLGHNYKTGELSSALIRSVRSQKLKREKNADGQFEYISYS